MSLLFDASYIAHWKYAAVFGRGTRLRWQKLKETVSWARFTERAKWLAERGDFLMKHFTTLEFPYLMKTMAFKYGIPLSYI